MYSTCTSDIAVLFSFEGKSFSTDKSLSASTEADVAVRDVPEKKLSVPEKEEVSEQQP